MNLWIDDVREPWRYGKLGWVWAKTFEEAQQYLQSGKVHDVSFDHDLDPDHYPWSGIPLDQHYDTGYDLLVWMKDNGIKVSGWITLHTMNPVGMKRMTDFLSKYGKELMDDPKA